MQRAVQRLAKATWTIKSTGYQTTKTKTTKILEAGRTSSNAGSKQRGNGDGGHLIRARENIWEVIRRT